MNIQVIEEGRENIFIPMKDSLAAWVKSKAPKKIHNFIANGPIMIGADHDRASVVEDILAAERLAITIGDEYRNNMSHALSIIKNNRLELYDIGEIKKANLDILNHDPD